MKSTKWTLQLRDFLKGLLLAVLSPIVPIIIQSISKGVFTLDWALIKTIAIGAFSAYLMKNLPQDDVKQAQKIVDDAKPKPKY